MNKVILIGRLTRDPMINYTQGERPMAIARFTLAVDRRMRGTEQSQQQTADFIQCVAFDKRAEVIEKYVSQGKKVAIVGRIQTGSYTNREGQRVYTTDIIVEDIEFVESKAADQSRTNGNTNYQTADVGADGFMSVPDGVEDEGLPFN